MLMFCQNNPRVSALSSAPISVSLMDFFFFLLFQDLNQKEEERRARKRLNCLRFASCKAVNNPRCRITVNDSFKAVKIKNKKEAFHLVHRPRHHSPHVRQIASAVFPLFIFADLCNGPNTKQTKSLFCLCALFFSFIAQNKHISLRGDELEEKCKCSIYS